MKLSHGTRRYRTIDSVESHFNEYLVEMRRRGEMMRPPERDLCECLRCSRGTARKLLKMKEAEGVIRKNHLARTLSLQAATNKKRLGSFAFVSEGDTMPGNLPWNKLWNRLRIKAEAASLSCELALFPFHRSEFDWRAMLSRLPDILVLTTMAPDARNRFLALKGKTVITTEEHYRGAIDNIVAMDNYAAGRLSATMLAEHGYRKPALLCDRLIVEGKLYVPFERRAAGFRTGCEERGIEFGDASEFWVEGQGVKLKIGIAKRAALIASRGFDAVFLHTDNDLAFLMEGLADEGVVVPKDMGVVTVNSFDAAISYHPKVSCVSHGSEPVADMLVRKILQILRTGDTHLGECLVTPGLYEGETLR